MDFDSWEVATIRLSGYVNWHFDDHGFIDPVSSDRMVIDNVHNVYFHLLPLARTVTELAWRSRLVEPRAYGTFTQ